jgi:hypothetical protein
MWMCVFTPGEREFVKFDEIEFAVTAIPVTPGSGLAGAAGAA